MPTDTTRRGPLRLHPLTYLEDGDGVVVGRVDIDSYAVFPPDGAALVRRLAEGMTPDAAAGWYRDTYGEPIDLEDLLDTLDELGFLDAGGPAVPDRPVRLRALGQALFSPPAWVLFAAVITAAVVACVGDSGLVPHNDHVFFSSYLLVIEITVAAGQIPLILIHELFHLLAARRLGVHARIRMGHRLYFVVFETVMDGLVMVPRRQRYLPILAGMLADLLLASGLTLAAAATNPTAGGTSLVSGICLALAFTTLIRFALEFLLFMRTDIYYLIATATGCVDLDGTTRGLLRNAFWRRAGRHGKIVDAAAWHPNDLRAARWYAPVFLAGYGLALVLFAVLFVPISWRFFSTAVGSAAGGDLRDSHFWDAAGLLVLNLAEPVLALAFKLRDRAQARRSTHKPLRGTR